MGGRAGVRILDAGCQFGALTLEVARQHIGWDVVAADLDRGALRQTRRAAQEAGLANVLPVQLDLTVPLPVGPFDAALAIECLSEIPDDDSVLRNVAASLRPGGRLYIHVPRAGWRPVLRGSPTQWYSNVRDGYAPDGLVARLESAGLTTVDIRFTTFAIVHAAEEARYRWLRGRNRLVRLAALPLLRLAEWTERAGLHLGAPRGLFVIARRAGGDARPDAEPCGHRGSVQR